MGEVNDHRRYLDPAVASRLSSVELRSRLIVEGFLLGLHRSPFHGFSIEFSQHRPYMQGDALKDIDWKVYGKTDKYYVKQYEEETNMRCSFFLDCSASMGFKYSSTTTKYEYGAMLASALSYLCIHQKDAAGITLYADTIKKALTPRASGIYLNEIFKAIAETTVSDKTATGKCLDKAVDKVNKRGLAIIISDFLDTPDSILPALKHFRFKKNEVIVFQILDPVEQSFALGKDAVFVDMETGEEMTSQPYQVQKSYQELFSSFQKRLKDECIKMGIDYNVVLTTEPFDRALFGYLQKRARMQ
ncbi:MAG: DUF58 domain-containing protein [Ignavibacteria bacterium]|nr:DUF58 domain-containing protein [Ignavibacteria bacterium]